MKLPEWMRPINQHLGDDGKTLVLTVEVDPEHETPVALAEVARLTAELAAERETVARLREEVALLNAHINKRNADDFHALAEHQHEVNTLRARIEAGIAAAWCMFCDGDGYAVTYDPKNPDEPCHVCQGSAKDNRVVKALRGEG